jgi:hypothetical protein
MYSLTIVCSTFIVLFALDNVMSASSIDIDTLQQAVNLMSDAQKEKIYQALLASKDSQSRQDDSNWCCNIDPGQFLAIFNDLQV